MSKNIISFAAALLFVFLLHTGCSPARYRQQADKETYGIIDEKSREVPAMTKEFSSEAPSIDPLQKLPPAPPEAYLSSYKENDEQDHAFLLNLEDALHIAATNSRDYQNQRESVFLGALALTGERHRFNPRFAWTIRGETAYDSDDKWTAGAQSGPSAEWLFASGARLSADLNTTATKILSGDASDAARSLFSLSLTQPLLRGRRTAALESLTQAEQDMIYELRNFVRFQRRFLTGVLADYYRVLEQRQRVENERVNHDNLVRIRRRSEALGEAGRLPEIQVDRARQNELSASDSLDLAEQRYLRAIDDLKIKLGISPEIHLLLDPEELNVLHEIDMAEPPVSREQSIEIALSNRLDLATQAERVEDSERRILVAEDALKPGLNLVLGTDASTPQNTPLNFSGGSQTSYARVDADLPLDRTAERNTYRRRLIEHERSLRDLQEKHDSVILEVTNRWRDFETAVSSYETQKTSVELAEDRVESTEMLFDAGRASTRDVLDAHEDLLRAQNRLAQTLVDFRVAALELERDMDILVFDEKGQLKEGAGYHEYTGKN